MEVSTRGIVLSTIKYSESSLVVKVFTEDLGNLTFMVKGARKRYTTHSAALFSHLNLIELRFRYRESREMHNLADVRSLYAYTSVPQNPLKGSIILFINELLVKAIREQEANQTLFEFIFDSMLWFDQQQSAYIDFHLAFGIKLIGHLGFMPQGKWKPETPQLNMQEGTFAYGGLPVQMMNAESSKAFSAFQECPMQNIGELHISNAQRRQLIYSMIEYFQFHLPGFGQMKSLEVLEEIYR